jgi:hypothetical protein
MKPRRLILHTAVSSATPSMHSYFNVSGRATSHFYLGRDGELEQYIETDHQSTANLEGNRDCITVESWDGYPAWSGSNVPPWTPAQVETLTRLAAWCHERHGIPLAQLPSSRPGTTGVGWHRQGIDGNFPTGLLAGRVSGGEKWSSSGGKVCPGDRRIAQIPDIIRRARGTGTPRPDREDDDMALKDPVNDEHNVKQVLNRLDRFLANEAARDKAQRARDEALLAAIRDLAAR